MSGSVSRYINPINWHEGAGTLMCAILATCYIVYLWGGIFPLWHLVSYTLYICIYLSYIFHTTHTNQSWALYSYMKCHAHRSVIVTYHALFNINIHYCGREWGKIHASFTKECISLSLFTLKAAVRPQLIHKHFLQTFLHINKTKNLCAWNL